MRLISSPWRSSSCAARVDQRLADHRLQPAADRRHTGHHVGLSRRDLPALQGRVDQRPGHPPGDQGAAAHGLPRPAGLVWFAIVTCCSAGGSSATAAPAARCTPSAATCRLRPIGIPIKRRLLQVLPMSGALAGLSGLLWVGCYSIAFTELAAGFEMTVIASCVIGGVSTAGGIGNVVGALLGVLFTGVINGALPVIHLAVLAAGDFRLRHPRRRDRQCPLRNAAPASRSCRQRRSGCIVQQPRAQLQGSKSMKATRTWELILVFLLLIVVAGFSATTEGFLDFYNLSDSTFNYSEKALIALVMALVIIAGEIDISVAATVALTSVMMGLAKNAVPASASSSWSAWLPARCAGVERAF